MKKLPAFAMAVVPIMAMAQTDPNAPLPNPLQSPNLSATCANWEKEKAANDPRAMQVVIGSWRGNSVEPGTPGVIGDTPITVSVTNTPQGTFSTNVDGCYAPYGFQPACATTFLYGEYAAHFVQDRVVAVAFLSAGSSRTGQALPVSCGLNYWRQLDPDTIQDPSGLVLRRVGN